MAQEFLRPGETGISDISVDAGLRAHMQSVFNYMGAGLALTGIVAWIVANTPLAGVIFGSPLKWVVMLAPLGFMIFMNMRAQTMSSATLKMVFWAFCATMGLSMGAIFLIFTSNSIARAFFVTAMMFAATSLYGYTTKRNLAGMASLMVMGIFGLIAASVVNIFLMSTALQWVSSVAGVIIFTALTAYTVQGIKQNYSESWGEDANTKLAVFGALQLYINFINAFQYILQLTGTLRRN